MTEVLETVDLESVVEAGTEVVVIQAKQQAAVVHAVPGPSVLSAESLPGSVGAEPFSAVVRSVEVVAVSTSGNPGVPGPAGPQGPPGASAAPTTSALNNSGAILARGMPVAVSGPSTITKAAAGSRPRVIGFVYDESIGLDTFGVIQTGGMLDASVAEWEAATGAVGGLVAGQQYFLSTEAGKITTSPDTSATVAPVGRAISTTRFLIDVEPPIF